MSARNLSDSDDRAQYSLVLDNNKKTNPAIGSIFYEFYVN